MRLQQRISQAGEDMAQIDFREKINWHRRYRSPRRAKTEHEIPGGIF